MDQKSAKEDLSTHQTKKVFNVIVDKPVDKMLKTYWSLNQLYHPQFPNFECLSIYGFVLN